MRRPRERIVVVGAGVAGLRAAERLRERGFTGELVIVGAERHKPYHRPALSKHFLSGELSANEIRLRSYVDLDARWKLGTAVRQLDTARRRVRLAGGPAIGYDGLVIATGVSARRPPGVPVGDERVRVLRTVEDARHARRMVARATGPIAVVGGGFTATEVASTLHDMGRDVLLVSRRRTLLGAALGPRLGRAVTKLHASRGVVPVVGTRVRNWIVAPNGILLHLTNNTIVPIGGAILAVGSDPAVGWLRGTPLDSTDGVLCEDTCHAMGAEDIVAAGDVARWPNMRFDGTPRRVEHWLNAVEMGRAAADNLLAGRAAAVPFTPVPRFWSEQYGVRFQAAGMPQLGDGTIRLDRDPATGRGVLGYVRERALVGVVGRESPRELLHWSEQLRDVLQPMSRYPIGKHSRRRDLRRSPEHRYPDGQWPPASVPEPTRYPGPGRRAAGRRGVA